MNMMMMMTMTMTMIVIMIIATMMVERERRKVNRKENIDILISSFIIQKFPLPDHDIAFDPSLVKILPFFDQPVFSPFPSP